MNFIRLLSIAPLLALVSCFALIQNSGRDPAELVGRSRPSIHAEFGKPTKTETSTTGEPIDYIPVKGSWKNTELSLALGFYTVLTLGVLEPFYTIQSAASKSSSAAKGQYLDLTYHDGKVMKARLSPLE
jgi:hypothetical protein